MEDTKPIAPEGAAKRRVVSAVAGLAVYLPLELSAHLVRFPKKSVAQSLLAPILPLAPILRSWIDVDSYGLTGTLFRAALFSGWMFLLATVFHRSKRNGAAGWRILMGILGAWSVLAVVGFWVLRMIFDASFGSR